jgi:hypothetical protein
MARTVVGSAVVVREKYYWPDAQLNVWTIIMLATAGTILGVFAQFMVMQNQLRQPIPWSDTPLITSPCTECIVWNMFEIESNI